MWMERNDILREEIVRFSSILGDPAKILEQKAFSLKLI